MTRAAAVARYGRAALGIALLALAAGCSGGDPAPSRPRIVVVLIDTLRPDHLSFHGHDAETAPYLARLAEGAAVFTNAFSTSCWTAPATASVFTGLYPTQHGVVEGFFAHQQRVDEVEGPGAASIEVTPLPAEIATLPEVLRAGGYFTFGLATNINVGEEIGFDRGFERFERLHTSVLGGGATADLVARELLGREAELRAADPLFVYLHFNDVHRPLHPRAPWYVPHADRMDDERARYDSEIRFLDEVLAELVPHFGWDEDTYLAVLSDHGEEFMEHGAYGHKRSLHSEVNRVLLMIRGPGVRPGRIDANVALIDLLPTLADLARLPAPAGVAGRSLAPLLAGGAAAERAADELRERPLFAHRSRVEDQPPLWSVTVGTWKLIQDGPRAALFDLAADPQERRDLAAERPELVAELRGLLQQFKAAQREGVSVQVELDAAGVEVLKELGYADGEDG